MSKKTTINVKVLSTEKLQQLLQNARGTVKNNIVNELTRRNKQ